MAVGLNQRAQQRTKRATECVNKITQFAGDISLKDLEDLFRRDMVSIDTFPRSHTGSSIVAFNRGNSPELTPVEQAAERNSGFPDTGKRQKDPVREEIKTIEKKLFQAEEILRSVVDSIAFLRDGVEKRRGRETTTPCEICHVLPIAKRGMCVDCYQEWIDQGSPEYSRWVAYMNSTRSSDGSLLVEEPPLGRPRVQTLDNKELVR